MIFLQVIYHIASKCHMSCCRKCSDLLCPDASVRLSDGVCVVGRVKAISHCRSSNTHCTPVQFPVCGRREVSPAKGNRSVWHARRRMLQCVAATIVLNYSTREIMFCNLRIRTKLGSERPKRQFATLLPVWNTAYTGRSTQWTIKTWHFIFDYNFGQS